MLKFPTLFLAGALMFSGAPARAQTPTNRSAIPILARPVGAPGLRREAGTWLFNDSIFVAPGENRGASGASPFIPNLRRDKKQKLPVLMPSKSGAPLNWATLPLPDYRIISAPGFDFVGLQMQLSAQVNAARATGQTFVGWSLPVAQATGELERTVSPALQKELAAPVLKRLRAVLDAVAPDSALVLEVETSRNAAKSALDMDALAPLCDAILLRVNLQNPDDLWTLKTARRVAEEQPDFDLPIFVAPTDPTSAPSEARLLEFFMGGATGFVLPGAQTPVWASTISRNAGLFAGAVTLEDAAVLPSLNPQILRLVAQLRAAGRVPLVGRLPADDKSGARNGESLFAIVDETTSLDTLSGLDKAARSGNTIYLEGVPNLKDRALLAKISDMTDATIEVLPAAKTEVLTLSDPWLFGDARGREIAVTQRLKWTLKTSLAAQARKKKGEDVLQAFSAAKLASDENGLLVAPLGKGRIMWLAHTPLNAPPDEAARRGYYAAIAGNLQGALARFEFASVEENVRHSGGVHLALRASKTGTPIIALFNDRATDAHISLGARSDAPVALDLTTEREIPALVDGYSSNVQITVPAQGFAWLTFGLTRAALDKERLAPRPKARIAK